jgi:hypothetical protein
MEEGCDEMKKKKERQVVGGKTLALGWRLTFSGSV